MRRGSEAGTEPDEGPDVFASPGLQRAERLCRESVSILEVDGAGLSMMTSAGHRGTVCATDEIAGIVEDLQFSLGEGPCFDAYVGGGPILIADITQTGHSAWTRWPVFTEAVSAAGVRALFAFPLLIGAIALGALDFYRVRPEGLSATQLREAWGIANAAADALLDVRAGAATDLPAGSAPIGASYRLEVHQATGMVSVQLNIGLEAAFLRLRAYAFARDLDLDEVSSNIVAGRLKLSEED